MKTQLISKLDDSIKWWISRRKPINEFEHLKNEIYEKLELWGKKDNITVTREKGNSDYSRYNIFILDLTYVFPEHLQKIKGYDIWCVSRLSTGIELSCHSDRHSRERL